MAKPTHDELFEFVRKLGDAEHEAACDLERQVESVKNVVDRWIAGWQVPDHGPVGAPQVGGMAPQEADARQTSQVH